MYKGKGKNISPKKVGIGLKKGSKFEAVKKGRRVHIQGGG